MIYMISYDLHAPTKNRENVEKSIESLGTWCKYVSTTYLVKTQLSSADVQSNAIKFIDSNDRMLICKVEKPIQGWLSNDQWKWIRENL